MGGHQVICSDIDVLNKMATVQIVDTSTVCNAYDVFKKNAIIIILNFFLRILLIWKHSSSLKPMGSRSKRTFCAQSIDQINGN